MGTAEPNYLVAYGGYDWDKHYAGEDEHSQIGARNEGEDHDRNQHHSQQEGSATARVGSRKPAHVVHLQGQAGLVGVHGHVLRAMVGEDAPYVWHEADSPNVGYEESDPYSPLDELNQPLRR